MTWTGQLHLPDESTGTAFGEALSHRLEAGDTVLLDGPLGVGKSHVARAIIRGKGIVEDVPSPTFTLVQTYGPPTREIWHADLYRLKGPPEVEELGLPEAFETALCLVEWPDRLGYLTPSDPLTLTFSYRGDGRVLVARGSARWREMIAGIVHAPA